MNPKILTRPELDAAVRANERRGLADGRDFAILVAGYQESRGLVVDGDAGPKTRAQLAKDRASALANVPPPVIEVPEAPSIVATDGPPWTPWDGPLKVRPVTTADLIALYGNPSDEDGHEDVAWARKHLVSRGPDNPFPGMYTEGAGRYVTVHRLVEPYVDEGFRRGAIAAPGFKLERVGGHNHRRMRHDTPEKAAARNHKPPLRALSRHAWGCALDINPDDNEAKYASDLPGGKAPKPWTPAWWKIWPRGIPEAFVLAMESAGWRWGGRWTDFIDPMHFELAGGPAHTQI